MLDPFEDRSTSDVDNPEYGYWGFIAEEMHEVDPRLVHYGSDGNPEGIQYDRMVAPLVNIVKRQRDEIEALKERLNKAGL